MTNIEWTHFPGYTGKSWNPVTGCRKIAQGCKNCYAETIATRFWGDRKFTDVQTHADRLDQPLRARKPTCWFVNSMSDLYHEDVPFEFIAAVYGVMAACPQHLFIILTKRPKRMREFMAWLTATKPHNWDEPKVCVDAMAAAGVDTDWFTHPAWPLPNVIHGYSASTQADLDAGMPDLLATPSALRCLSLEPLIGPIDVSACLGREPDHVSQGVRRLVPDGLQGGAGGPVGIHQIIVGGESGPRARPCDVAWIRSIVAQCKAAGVPCFVKQLGAKPFEQNAYQTPSSFDVWCSEFMLKDRKGADPSEWPADLRVRQFPVLGVTHG